MRILLLFSRLHFPPFGDRASLTREFKHGEILTNNTNENAGVLYLRSVRQSPPFGFSVKKICLFRLSSASLSLSPFFLSFQRLPFNGLSFLRRDNDESLFPCHSRAFFSSRRRIRSVYCDNERSRFQVSRFNSTAESLTTTARLGHVIFIRLLFDMRCGLIISQPNALSRRFIRNFVPCT